MEGYYGSSQRLFTNWLYLGYRRTCHDSTGTHTRHTAQTIIAMLAMADFILALSGIFGASIQLTYIITNSADNLLSERDCYNFDMLCQIQAFVGMWMLGSTFTWTSMLTLHFFLVTVCTHSTWPHKLMPLYNIVAWLIPLFGTLPMLLLGKLGYIHYLTWTCFMTSTGVDIYIQWEIVETTTAICIFLDYTCVLFIGILKSVSIHLYKKCLHKNHYCCTNLCILNLHFQQLLQLC